MMDHPPQKNHHNEKYKAPNNTKRLFPPNNQLLNCLNDQIDTDKDHQTVCQHQQCYFVKIRYLLLKIFKFCRV